MTEHDCPASCPGDTTHRLLRGGFSGGNPEKTGQSGELEELGRKEK
ncbi:MAG: hypothetical protein IJC59_02395 [Lachnospiraceae bacterium]|nr:hypothetical protein [Lachnospiraceae bacterium]